MIRSSIDIGTNSVLLLIAEIDGTNLTVLHEEQRIPRLGQGVDSGGKLSEEAQDRVLSVLKEYMGILKHEFPGIADDTVVTATSAVRDAANRSEFIRAIDLETGWTVRLLSGRDEARVTYRGALAVLEEPDRNQNISVLDIGGGSTEIATGTGLQLEAWDSLNMGSVRFTERFLLSDPPVKQHIEEARKEIRAMLAGWQPSPRKINRLAGVAGTVTSVAGIHLGLSSYETEKINGYRLPIEYIEETIEQFSSISSTQIESQYPVFMKGRGDVITAGLLILAEFMTYCGCEEIIVSTGGIRHGILLPELK